MKKVVPKKNKILNIFKILLIVVLFILLFVGLLAYSASKWYVKYYSDVPFAQILYHLLSPLEGTRTDFLNGFEECLPLPIIGTIIVLALFIGLPILIKNKEIKKGKLMNRVIHIALPVISICSLVIGSFSLYSSMGIDSYIESSNTTSDLYESYYVNGSDVDFTFPNKKRNLIYIYLESMETTYENTKNGGLTSTNYIPELTKLQNKNLTFNGGDSDYNGYYQPSLNGWTIAGIVGQTAGLPLNVGEQEKNTLTEGDFLPNAYSIGNILEDAGYTQEFVCGSDIVFGGRKNYLDQHGNYTYLDLAEAKARGYIDEDYGVWWGYEDSKLVDYVKTELTTLSQSDQPFNLTMLTADTHFPYGYQCSDCESKYDKNYSNVMACSSKRIAELVKWIQKQDFYENTTIVIAGDHKTMDTDWFSDKDTTGYTRKVFYTIINPAIEPVRTDAREICTYDLYPTTLAAMGVTFDSDRLGLGTNLFGEEDTLVEKLGFDELNTLLSQHSDLYDSLANGRDLYEKENNPDSEEDTEEADDYSWQVPSYYDGEVYDYTAYQTSSNDYYYGGYYYDSSSTDYSSDSYTDGGDSGGGDSGGGSGGDSDTVPSGGDSGTVPSGGDSGTVPSGGDSGTVPSGDDSGTVPSGGDSGTVPSGGDSGVVPSGGETTPSVNSEIE